MPDQPYYGDKYIKPDTGKKKGDKITPEQSQKIRDILKKNHPKKASNPRNKVAPGPNIA